MRLLSLAAPIAERQLGLVAHRQLRRAGATPSTIHEATCAGRLVPVERGVSLVAGAPVTAEVRLLAKVLSAGDEAVLSHRSAAWRAPGRAAAPS